MASLCLPRPHWVACAILLAVTHPANAEVGTASALEQPRLTALQAAVRDSWSRHPAAGATEQTLTAARARTEAASQPLYNPDLEFSFDDEGAERTATAGLGFTLDLSGKRRARSDVGQAELSVAEAEAELRRNEFARQYLQGWVEHQTARDRLQIGAQRLELMERFGDLAERQLAAGDISSLERDLALLARDEAQAEQATLHADAASATEMFRAVGGDPRIEADFAAIGVPGTWSEDSSWQVTLTPEARVAAAMTTSASTRIAVAERDRRPDPSISVYGGQKDVGAGKDDVIGVTVSVPLFIRNSFRAEVAAAQAEASAATAEQRRVELELIARAERTVSTYGAVREAWTRWSRSPGTDVATRTTLLERLWRAGEISTAEYLVQLKQSLDTALAGADLYGRLWRSYVDALYATGQLDAWVGFNSSEPEVIP